MVRDKLRIDMKSHNERGAVLLMVLVGVVLLGLMAGIAGSSWKTIVQRGQEEDLLWKGGQIRKAIGRYYEFQGLGADNGSEGKTLKKGAFPKTLEELLEDPRVLTTTRHLRRLYKDPMTGDEWGVIVAPKGGGIMGVRSLSTEEPFKQDNFSEDNKAFSGKKSYSEWQFVYWPKKSKKTDKSGEKKSSQTSD